jgi:histidinol-phosphate aminotransferase
MWSRNELPYFFGLSCLTRKPRQVVIAQPSFPLYEMHCRYENIPYEIWPLDKDFNYSLDLLPKLNDPSLLIFASPNNPCGNALKKTDLVTILSKNPQTLVLADEAYFEYNDPEEEYLDLLSRFDNLIILRTFSKTLAAAGIRIGYMVGAKAYIEQFHKLRLPFLINSFTIEAAKIFLEEKVCRDFVEKLVHHVVSEREKMSLALSQMRIDFVPSKANFFMLRFDSNEKAELVNQRLLKEGILARTIYKGPRLKGCLRLSIGTTEENELVLATLKAMRVDL